MTYSMAPADIGGDLPWSWPGGAASGQRGMVAEILAEVSMEALQGDSLVDVLQRIVNCLARHLPIAVASIIVLNDERTHCVQEVWAGIERDLRDELPWPVTLGASGRCVQTGQPQLADVGLDADYAPRNDGVKSEYLVPIRHREHLHGILNLESTFKDFFTPPICAMFDAVALQIAGAVHLARLASELEIANRKLEHLSMSDGLTGIANRRSFDQALAREWASHQDRGASMALLLVDVDYFKALNDARGHPFGDDCLRALARMCADMAPDALAHVSRYGGEEFVLILPDSDLPMAHDFAVNLCRGVEALALEHPASPLGPHITVSIGVSALCPGPKVGPKSLLMAADRALYAAKAEGRNRVVARDRT
ncbi:MAG: diguanylate cyclase [Rhodanobacter sp.]